MMNDRPNILLIHTHDLGRFLNVYSDNGAGGIVSPHLDRFAQQGVLFTNCYCHAPLCSASRGTLFTGRYSHSNGVMGLVNKVDEGWDYYPGEKTIPMLLRGAGYFTCLFGQQHESENSRTLGYHEVLEFGDPDQAWCAGVADRTVDFLTSPRAKEQPFFASVGFFEPHRHGRDYPLGLYSLENPESIRVPSFLKDCSEVREDLNGFFGAIEKADAAAGRVLTALEDAGLADDTWVIFTTDHGAHFPRAKETLYDRGLEISMMMRWPGRLSEGAVFEPTVGHVDLLPTLLDALGIERPENLQGRSYWSALSTHEPIDEAPLFAEKNWMNGYHPMRAVRAKGFKLIRNYPAPPENERYRVQPPPTLSEKAMNYSVHRPCDGIELYDLKADPDELNNLAGNRDIAEVEQELTALLDDWMKRTDDPLLDGPVPTRMEETARRLGLC